MHALNLFVLVPILISYALAAQTNVTIPDIPQCAVNCTDIVLLPSGCQVTNLRDCLCPSVELQRNFSMCLLTNCSMTAQVETYTILQNVTCKGVPYPSRSPELIRDVIIITAVTFPVIIMRFISRSLVSNKIGLDDCAVVLAALIMIPMAIIPILNSTRGFGTHFWNVPVQNQEGLRKLYYISQVLYMFVTGLVKLSILLLYLRIFLNKSFRLAVHIVMACIIAQTVANCLAISFQCTPVDSYWDNSIKGTCIHSLGFVYSAAGLSILQDFVIMFLPVLELKALKLDLRKKFALGFMFALGSFACITSMIRLKYIVTYGTSMDITYDNVDVIIWSVLETFTAMICTSLMCFRPLLVRLIPAVFETHRSMTTSIPTPNAPQSWSNLVSTSRFANRLRPENHGIELDSVDEESNSGGSKDIRVQTTWLTETTTGDEPEKGSQEKFGGIAEVHADGHRSKTNL